MFSDNGRRLRPEHPQLIFIHGYGTTSLVHALAEEYNFKVITKLRSFNSFALIERRISELHRCLCVLLNLLSLLRKPKLEFSKLFSVIKKLHKI